MKYCELYFQKKNSKDYVDDNYSITIKTNIPHEIDRFDKENTSKRDIKLLNKLTSLFADKRQGKDYEVKFIKLSGQLCDEEFWNGKTFDYNEWLKQEKAKGFER